MKKISILIATLLSLVFTFNVFAMEIEYNNPNDPNEPTLIIPNPTNEKRNADRTLDYKWTWISDEWHVFSLGKEPMIEERIFKNRLIMA